MFCLFLCTRTKQKWALCVFFSLFNVKYAHLFCKTGRVYLFSLDDEDMMDCLRQFRFSMAVLEGKQMHSILFSRQVRDGGINFWGELILALKQLLGHLVCELFFLLPPCSSYHLTWMSTLAPHLRHQESKIEVQKQIPSINFNAWLACLTFDFFLPSSSSFLCCLILIRLCRLSEILILNARFGIKWRIIQF